MNKTALLHSEEDIDINEDPLSLYEPSFSSILQNPMSISQQHPIIPMSNQINSQFQSLWYNLYPFALCNHQKKIKKQQNKHSLIISNQRFSDANANKSIQ